MSFWNDAALGAIELHLIDRNIVSHDTCVASEETGDRSLVRIVEPGEDKMVTLFKTHEGDADGEKKKGITYTIDNTKPAVRVKPRFAPCGEGFDVIVDFKDRYAVYKVTNNKAFNGYEARNETNVPLKVERMGASEKVGLAAAAKGELLLPAEDAKIATDDPEAEPVTVEAAKDEL